MPGGQQSTTTREGKWLRCIVEPAAAPRAPAPLLGVLHGEGIGVEVVEAALEVLRQLERAGGQAVVVETSGPIGLAAKRTHGAALPDDVADFCEEVFARGGAVLTGPGGGRYVYDLRRRLGLFLKLVPIQARTGLPQASPLRPEALQGVDLLVVRETFGDIYQGRSEQIRDRDGQPVVRHAFDTCEADVHRFLAAASRLARARHGELTVVVKEGGAPVLSELWRRCALEAAAADAVECSFVDVDLMAYQLVRRPQDFDVVAASNLAGDVLGDLAAVLMGSRGMSFSGNFSARGDAVYQTNHGAAYDIADSDRANPVGQILSLAMLLRESLGLEREARAVEDGVRSIWARGLRTADVAAPGDEVVGTSEMTRRVAEAAAAQLGAVTRVA